MPNPQPQPGDSWCPVCKRLPAQKHKMDCPHGRIAGGSGAGSRVELTENRIDLIGYRVSPDAARAVRQLRADLEAVQKQLSAEHEVGTLEHARQHITCGQIIAETSAALEAAHAELERKRPVVAMWAEMIDALQSSGLGVLGESLSASTLPRIIAEHKAMTADLTQARARIATLEGENAQLKRDKEYHEWCGDCGEARADIPRCTVCTIEYVPRQARMLALDAAQAAGQTS